MDFRVVGLLGLGVAIAVCLVALVRIGAGQLRRRNGGTVTVGVVKSVEVRYQAAGEGPTMVQRTPVVEFQDAFGTIRQFQNAHPVDCPDAGGFGYEQRRDRHTVAQQHGRSGTCHRPAHATSLVSARSSSSRTGSGSGGGSGSAVSSSSSSSSSGSCGGSGVSSATRSLQPKQSPW